MYSPTPLEHYAVLRGLPTNIVGNAIISGQLRVHFDEMGYPCLSLGDNICDRPHQVIGGRYV